MLRSAETSGYRADAVTEEVDDSAAAHHVTQRRGPPRGKQRQQSAKANGTPPKENRLNRAVRYTTEALNATIVG